MTAKKPRLRRACGVIAAMLTITRLTAVTAPAAVLTITRLKKRTQSGAFLLNYGVPGGSAHIHEPYRRDRPGGCAHIHAP